MSLCAIVVTYNLEKATRLKFDEKNIIDTLLVKRTKKNNERIKKLNPQIDLHYMDITIFERRRKDNKKHEIR